jgi:hypothetical protein
MNGFRNSKWIYCTCVGKETDCVTKWFTGSDENITYRINDIIENIWPIDDKKTWINRVKVAFML